jgi:4'-phosphopantetheinyl transferase
MDSRNPIFLLKPGEVHLWLFNLDQPAQPHPDWERLLSNEEIIRSERFIADSDRKRFIARRGILRQLLGHYCGVDPAGVSYQANPNGKLSLSHLPIAFNISKSENRIAYVFTLLKCAGVDIEQVRPLPDLSLLAKRCFSQQELAGLAGLPQSLQLEAFYHTWTQKEAFIKAKGLGLSQPLKDFSVSVDPTKPGRLISITGCPNEPSEWKMTCFKPEADWRVTVCVRTEKDINVLLKLAEENDLISIEPS